MPDAFRILRAAMVAALVGTLFAGASGAARAPISLEATLTPFLARYELPALAAAVVKDGKIIAAAAVGTRKAGANLPVTLDDRFHLGSNTKAMTALLAGMLVDEGKLRWDSTVADVFPELAEKMDPGLKRVTLEQLLSHTSGVPADNEAIENLIYRAQLQPGNLDEMRYWVVREWNSEPLAASPGTKWAYSNMNYVIAGAMIERLRGKTWDELITERVFTPLGLRSAGLGPQATLGRIDAPLGHDVVDGKPKALLAGPNGDNPLVIGPAGIVHMSVLDFARWAGWHAGEGKRGPALVRPETMRKLHTMVGPWPFPPGTEPGWPSRGCYGLGMGEVIVDWAPEPLLHHLGQNAKNLASIWIEPKRDFAMVLVTNIDTKKANDALYALSADLYRRFGGAKSGGAGRRGDSSSQHPLAPARCP